LLPDSRQQVGPFVLGAKMKNVMIQEKKERVVTFLNRQEVDFLDKVGKDALFSSGIKLSRAKIISWLVDFLKALEISGENIRTEKDLEDKIEKVLEENTKTITPPATVSECMTYGVSRRHKSSARTYPRHLP